MAYVNEDRTIYEYSGGTWNAYANIRDKRVIGDGVNEFEVIFAEIHEVEETSDYHTRDWRVPKINQEMTFLDENNVLLGNGLSPYQPKLLVFHGLQDDSLNDDYPLATQGFIDYSETEIEDQSLKFNSKYSVLKDLDYWYQFLRTARTAKCTALFSSADLKRITYKTIFRTSKAKYLMKNMRHQLSQGTGKTLVELELYVL